MSADWSPVEYRECSDALTFDKFDKQRSAVISKLVLKFDFISLIGPHFTGKTTFADRLRQHDPCFMFWDRQKISGMVASGLGNIPERIHGALNKQEEFIFKEMWKELPDHKIMIEQLGGTKGRRKNYGAMHGKSSCLLVFDVPYTEQLKRYWNTNDIWWQRFSSFDAELYLSKQSERFVWPKFDEGWDKIYYINTCGDDGVEYLSPLLTMVEK